MSHSQTLLGKGDSRTIFVKFLFSKIKDFIKKNDKSDNNNHNNSFLDVAKVKCTNVCIFSQTTMASGTQEKFQKSVLSKLCHSILSFRIPCKELIGTLLIAQITLLIFSFLSKGTLPFFSRNNSHSALQNEVFAKDGAWCWFADPRAVYHEGKLILINCST